MCTLEINKSIENCELPLDEIAYRSHISPKTLWELRKGKRKTADKIFALSKAINEPGLIQAYRFDEDPISQQIGFVPLNSVDRSHVVILVRAKVETQEFFNKIDQMVIVSMNKQTSEQYSKADEEVFFDGFHEMLDVMHNLEEYFFESMRTWGIDRISKEVKKHNEKCIARGYAINKEAFSYERCCN